MAHYKSRRLAVDTLRPPSAKAAIPVQCWLQSRFGCWGGMDSGFINGSK